MKERMTAFLTLGCIFSLFFYYKVYSNDNNNFSSLDNQNKTQEVVDKLINEIDEIETQISDSSEEIINKKNSNECSLDQNETDVLTFSDAFKYYRNCNGKEGTFVWNKNEYSTLLVSEAKEIPSLITNNSSLISEDKVDKHHYQLQKEMIGVSLDTK